MPGLEDLAERELRRVLGQAVVMRGRPLEGRIAVEYRGDPRRFSQLRTVVAAHAVATFVVPRPKALLGHEHFQRLLTLVDRVVGLSPAGAYRSFRLSAAGSDTPVFARLADEIGAATGLVARPDQADLQVAVRRCVDGAPGWQVLVRLGPRPLSTRAWRVCNLAGALNATVARAMVELAGPSATERFLNVACGSGTLLVERLELGSAKEAIGVDLDRDALRCARANLEASGQAGSADLVRADAGYLSFPAASFDTIVVDLPFGMLVGSAGANERLYPALIAEAARVAVPGASLVAVTAARRLFAATMDRFAREWTPRLVLPIKLSFQRGYVRPSIYHFARAA